MFDKIERNLSKTSVFSAEILKIAPAELAVVRDSRKYRDLRKMLLNALTEKAWGVRLKLSAETESELRHQVRNLNMAGKSWERAAQLQKLHGLKLVTHYVIGEEKLSATIDMYFDGIDPEE